MIKSILGGKSKNLCDVAYLLTLPLDKKFEGYGFWEVEISVEPNTAYTLSRENANQINIGDATYLGITNQYGLPNGGTHNQWLNHNDLPYLCHKNVQITSNSDGKLWVFFSSPVYKLWQKNLNPFGYIQLEKGSTATEYVPHELTSYKSIMKVSDVCQLVDKSKIPTTRTISGVTFTNNGDGSVTVDGTSTHQYYSEIVIPIDGSLFIPGHVYLNGTTAGAFAGFVALYGPVAKDYLMTPQHIYTLPSGKDFNKFRYIIRVDKGKTANNYKCTPQPFDLTKMFGAGNEPKTVAEFKAKFPNDYYPYSPSCFVTSFDERMPCKTKNLFSSSTEVGTLEGGFGGSTVARNFEENKWYQGFTTNGYYDPGNVLDFDIHPNSLYVYSSGAGYGMSRAIKCEPNTKYFISCSYSHISGGEGNVYVGYYDEGGNFISNSNIDTVYKINITTPSNCKWLIINFTTRGVGKVYFSDIQLVKGTTATDYVPYGYV